MPEFEALTDNEMITLECLAESSEPVGSIALVDKLHSRGITASSATIGRVLYRLESLGYVYKVSNQGRCISELGEQALARDRSIRTISEHQKRLTSLITSSSLDGYLSVLEARRAVERESARLAAVHITDTELEHLRELLRQQEIQQPKGESIAQIDVDFHRSIARASRNPVFESLYQVLFAYGQQSPLFEMIRARRRKATSAHFGILEALEQHDPKLAEQRMIDHIDNLILDVEDFMHDMSIHKD